MQVSPDWAEAAAGLRFSIVYFQVLRQCAEDHGRLASGQLTERQMVGLGGLARKGELRQGAPSR